MAKITKKQIVFAISPPNEMGQATMIIGFTRAAWHHMDTGNTHNVSLEKAIGIPLNLVFFTGKDHDDVMDKLQSGARLRGEAIDDRRRDDFKAEPVISDEMVKAALDELRLQGSPPDEESMRVALRAGMMAPAA